MARFRRILSSKWAPAFLQYLNDLNPEFDYGNAKSAQENFGSRSLRKILISTFPSEEFLKLGKDERARLREAYVTDPNISLFRSKLLNFLGGPDQPITFQADLPSAARRDRRQGFWKGMFNGQVAWRNTGWLFYNLLGIPLKTAHTAAVFTFEFIPKLAEIAYAYATAKLMQGIKWAWTGWRAKTVILPLLAGVVGGGLILTLGALSTVAYVVKHVSKAILSPVRSCIQALSYSKWLAGASAVISFGSYIATGFVAPLLVGIASAKLVAAKWVGEAVKVVTSPVAKAGFWVHRLIFGTATAASVTAKAVARPEGHRYQAFTSSTSRISKVIAKAKAVQQPAQACAAVATTIASKADKAQRQEEEQAAHYYGGKHVAIPTPRPSFGSADPDAPSSASVSAASSATSSGSLPGPAAHVQDWDSCSAYSSATAAPGMGGAADQPSPARSVRSSASAPAGFHQSPKSVNDELIDWCGRCGVGAPALNLHQSLIASVANLRQVEVSGSHRRSKAARVLRAQLKQILLRIDTSELDSWRNNIRLKMEPHNTEAVLDLISMIDFAEQKSMTNPLSISSIVMLNFANLSVNDQDIFRFGMRNFFGFMPSFDYPNADQHYSGIHICYQMFSFAEKDSVSQVKDLKRKLKIFLDGYVSDAKGNFAFYRFCELFYSMMSTYFDSHPKVKGIIDSLYKAAGRDYCIVERVNMSGSGVCASGRGCSGGEEEAEYKDGDLADPSRSRHSRPVAMGAR